MTAGGSCAPPIIQILSVPSGCFLNQAQIEATERGEPFVDIAQCTPMQLEHAAPQLLEHAPRSEPKYEEPAAIESAPLEPEPDPVMKRAMEMGYTPLPRRIRPVD